MSKVVEGTQVLVEWKRGKHKGLSGIAVYKGGQAQWEGEEFILPCTLYYNQKKRAFDEKDLYVNVQTASCKRLLGKAQVSLAALALLLGEQSEKSFARRDLLEGTTNAHLEYLFVVKRLVDPRGTPQGHFRAPSQTPTPSSSSDSANKPQVSPQVPTLSATVLPFGGGGGVGSSGGGEGGPDSPIQRSPRVMDSGVGGGYASAGGIPSGTGSLRHHMRNPSSTTIPGLQLSEFGTQPLQGSSSAREATATTTSPVRQKSKGVLPGHRRGKSHAVTPEELKGLQLPGGGDPQNAASPSVQQNTRSVKLPFGIMEKKSRDSRTLSTVGLVGSNPSPSPTPSPASGRPPSFLITSGNGGDGDSSSDEMTRTPLSWLDVDVSAPPSQQPHASTAAGHENKINNLNNNNTNSQTSNNTRAPVSNLAAEKIIFENFVAFSEMTFTDELSVSAYVLFRCLCEWDSFQPEEGRLFREQLLEGFEKLTKTVQDQPRSIYWLSTLVSLMHLLRANHKPIPRSEVAKSNALVVFLERLRGLVHVFFSRVAQLCMAELKPLLVSALLEQNSLGLSDLSPAPKARGGGGGGGAAVRPGTADVIKVLDATFDGLAVRKIPSSVSSQLFARLARSIAAHTLNSLLAGDPRLCTFSNGLQLKRPLSDLRGWFQKHQFEAAAKNLAPLDEVVSVLTMNKSVLVDAEVRKEVCPSLSQAQLAQLLLHYTPDEFDSEPIPPAILERVAVGLSKPYEFRVSEDVTSLLSLDLTETQYTLNNSNAISLPSGVLQEPSLAFLFTDANSDQSGKW